MSKVINVRLAWIVLVIFLLFSSSTSAQMINTIVGTGVGGFNGDSISATSAQINSPRVTMDPYGNIYFADYSNFRIRRVDAKTKMITTIAGNGTQGYGGDGHPAINASIDPAGLAVDSFGNIYIADFNNHRIRKVVEKTGIITTIAGTGVSGYSGDGGLAIDAKVGNIAYMTVDRLGNLYFPDEVEKSSIRKIDVKTGIITKYASGFSEPRALAFDSKGNLIVIQRRHWIRKVDALTKAVSNFAGTGSAAWSGDGRPALQNGLPWPYGLAIDSKDNVYLGLSLVSYRIVKIDALTSIVTTVAGIGTPGYSGDNGPALLAQFEYASSLVCDQKNNLIIGDISNARIRKIYFSPDCEIVTSGIIKSTTGDVFCGNGKVTLSLDSSIYVNGPIKHSWWSSTDKTNWGFVDSTSSITDGINKTTFYKCIIRCASGDSATTAIYTIQVFTPSNSTVELANCSNNFPFQWNGIAVDKGGNSVAKYITENSNGCDSVVTLNVKINDIDSTIEKKTVCKKDLPIVWNEIFIPETALTNSDYVNYYGVNSSGCDSIVTLDLLVKQNCDETSVDETLDAEIKINLYPNPNNGVFTLEMTTLEKYVSLEIINALGITVFKEEVPSSNNIVKKQIQVAHFSSGIYSLSVHTKERNKTIRFVVMN